MTTPSQIYLDNNATTAPAPECIDAMLACLRSGAGNPSSKHGAGETAKRALGLARNEIARFIGANAAEIVLTSGGTEANHLAIHAAITADPARRHIITSAVEHASTIAYLRSLEASNVSCTYLPVDADGRLVLDALAACIRPDTALVSLMWANNETGVLFPVAEAAALCRQRGVLFHTDAVQAAGKTPIDVATIPVDMLSISGHKLHGPQGTGALFVRKGLKIGPFIHGAQERGRRGGTENVPGHVGFAAACALVRQSLTEDAARMTALRERFESGVLARIPGAIINAAAAPRLPNTTSLRFGEIEAEIILGRLDRRHIYASAGAACGSARIEPSHVLLAQGMTAAEALATIRVSLCRTTTADEIDAFLTALESVVSEAAALAA